MLAIVGPTGVGKTSLGVAVAKRYDGEIISADSRQVYQGMDIATGKEVQQGEWREIDGRRVLVVDDIFIQGLDLAKPDQSFSAAEWLASANACIDATKSRGHGPIIVGGTGLYIQALTDGLAHAVPANPLLRQELTDLSVQDLQMRLQELNPNRWEELNVSDRQNPVRLVRAIEVSVSKFEFSAEVDNTNVRQLFQLGLTASQEELYARADRRVDEMVKAGLIEETKTLLAEYAATLPSMSGIGYAEIGEHLNGAIRLDEAVQKIKYRTHDYIRRQNTWWRKRDVTWVDVTNQNWVDEAIDLAEKHVFGSRS